MLAPLPADETHFQKFLELLALEHQAEAARLKEYKRTLSPADLEKRGLVLLDLESADEAVGFGGRFLVTLEKPNRQPFFTALSNGDMVELRPRRSDETTSAIAVVTRASRVRI